MIDIKTVEYGDHKYVEKMPIKLIEHPFDAEVDRIKGEIDCMYTGETYKGIPQGLGIAVYNHIDEEDQEVERDKKVVHKKKDDYDKVNSDDDEEETV